ncbi:MAG: stage III sporulation protein AE [Clostridia bacterium]|nr:stage III sporulation protein AE [Clostridia bacterium]MDE7328673.1 stage III sporulation protein AE [Clostridia bacterium]
MKKIKARLNFSKYLIVALLICIAVVFALQSAQVCYADKAQDESEKTIQDNVDENLDKMDLSKLEELLASLGDDFRTLFGSDATSTIKSIVNGDFQGGFSDFLSILTKGIGKSILDVLPMVLTIVAVAVIYSLLEGLSSGFVRQPTKQLIYFATYSAIILVVMIEIGSIISLTTNTIRSIKTVMEAIFPILLTLVTLLGGVNSSAVFKPMMVTLTSFITTFISSVIIPFFIAAIAFSVVGNLTKSVKLDKLTGFFKSSATYVLGGVFSLFMAFLTFQGLTGGVIDSVSIKTAKFAIQSYVPILGGYLSDGFDLMLASLVLIKNSIGIIGLLTILSVIALPTIKIAVLSLGLKLASGIIEPLCDSKFSKMLHSISSNLILLIVSLVGVGFMFLMTIMLVIYTFNAGVV